MSKILCVGDSCADIIIPYGDVKQGMVDSPVFNCGGAAANTACALGKLGCDVAFAGKAGKDLYGLEMKKEMDNSHVNTDYFLIDEKEVSTQILVVVDENKDRYPFLMPNERPSYLEIYTKELDRIDLRDTEYILSNGMMLFKDPAASSITTFLKKAHDNRIKIILDINLRPETINEDRRYLEEVLNISDCILGSTKDDFIPLSPDGTMNYVIDKYGKDKVIVAHDKDGSTVYHQDKAYYCKSYKVDVIDSIGAGDAFNAGFIFGLVNGYDLEQCNILANKTAAFSLKEEGARHTPNKKDLEKFPAL